MYIIFINYARIHNHKYGYTQRQAVEETENVIRDIRPKLVRTWETVDQLMKELNLEQFELNQEDQQFNQNTKQYLEDAEPLVND